MSWDIFSKSKIQYFLEKLKGKFVQKETGKGLSSNDYTTTDKNKVALIDNTTTSATGNPISIADLKSAQIALNPVITFEPIQAGSGTPSPSNIRAISGYDKIEVLSCGVNVWDEQWEVGSINNNDGQNNNSDTSNIRSKNYNIIKPNATYYQKVPSGAYVWIHYYDANKNWISGVALTTGGGTFTTPNNESIKYFRIRTTNNYGNTYNNNIGINYPATQTSYVASNKTTDLSESLGQTVYGGSYDVRTGKLISNRIFVNLKGHTASVYGNDGIYISNVLNRTGQRIKGICSHAFVRTTEPTWESGQMQLGAGNATIYWLNILTILGKTIQEFNTWLATEDVWVCYDAGVGNYTEIQFTPHEIALSQGYNYISTNGTSISLAYHNGEVATHADVEQLAETVNELSQAFQDGCDEIMGAVAAKGVTPVSNSPDDVSKAIRSLVTYEQPIEFDYRCGYIMNSVWHYEKPTDTLSDIYEVKNGHIYYMFFGNVTGTRFRAITTTTDIRTVTSGTITGDQSVKNANNPGPLSYVTFTSTVDGYFIVCKDNVGKTGITTYVQDRTTM